MCKVVCVNSSYFCISFFILHVINYMSIFNLHFHLYIHVMYFAVVSPEGLMED